MSLEEFYTQLERRLDLDWKIEHGLIVAYDFKDRPYCVVTAACDNYFQMHDFENAGAHLGFHWRFSRIVFVASQVSATLDNEFDPDIRKRLIEITNPFKGVYY